MDETYYARTGDERAQQERERRSRAYKFGETVPESAILQLGDDDPIVQRALALWHNGAIASFADATRQMVLDLAQHADQLKKELIRAAETAPPRPIVIEGKMDGMKFAPSGTAPSRHAPGLVGRSTVCGVQHLDAPCDCTPHIDHITCAACLRSLLRQAEDRHLAYRTKVGEDYIWPVQGWLTRHDQKYVTPALLQPGAAARELVRRSDILEQAMDIVRAVAAVPGVMHDWARKVIKEFSGKE